MDTTVWIILIVSGLLFTAFLIVIAFVAKNVAREQQKRPRKFLESPRKYPDKGERGERYIASLLEQHCMTEHDRVINGAIMYDPRRAMSSEIDHILICSSGVYVIETKNLGGDIYGSDEEQTWRQCLADGEIVHTLHSPVRQNGTHTYLIRGILRSVRLGNVPVHGFVVFVEGNTRYIQSKYVCTPFELHRMLAEAPPAISPAVQDRIYQTLYDHIKCYPITKEQHVAAVRTLHTDDQ